MFLKDSYLFLLGAADHCHFISVWRELKLPPNNRKSLERIACFFSFIYTCCKHNKRSSVEHVASFTSMLIVPNTTPAVSSKVLGLVILHHKLYLPQTNHIYRQSGPHFDYRSVKPGHIIASCSSDLPSPNK